MFEKTLLLGNGFSCALFDGIPSWVQLISSGLTDIDNYPVLYEVELDKSERDENDFKKDLATRLENVKLKPTVATLPSISKFGDLLRKNEINNIVTTNYDDGIAYILINYCGYVETIYDNAEDIYSIHRYTELFDGKSNHRIKIWKMHGDIKNPKTMQLGLDQYGCFLANIKDYVKGNYSYIKDKVQIKYASIENRLSAGTLGGASWIDLLFVTDVYIAGFGMSFSEIDIWWLLIKRMRIKKATKLVNNTLHYIYSREKSNDNMDKSIENALSSVGVQIHKIDRSQDFIRDTLDVI